MNADELRRLSKEARQALPGESVRRVALYPHEADAIADLIEAAAGVIENDAHIDFGIAPPGWKQTHDVLRAALSVLEEGK